MLTCFIGFAYFNFNPLHREGGDSGLDKDINDDIISIHSTARVETHPPLGHRPYPAISIHSTARVETAKDVADALGYAISIHSTARVETVCVGTFPFDVGISIHSTARVETWWRWWWLLVY